MSTFTNHNALKAAMIKELERLQDELLDDVLVTVVKKTGEDTGALKKSWKRDGDKVVSDLEYALYHEFGSREKNIKPVRPLKKSRARIKRILKKKAKESEQRL